MILFELMESDHPYDGKEMVQIILNAKEGKIKPLKSKRSAELVALYNSMRDMVLNLLAASFFTFYWIFFNIC
jgi:hypothetical protein